MTSDSRANVQRKGRLEDRSRQAGLVIQRGPRVTFANSDDNAAFGTAT